MPKPVWGDTALSMTAAYAVPILFGPRRFLEGQEDTVIRSASGCIVDLGAHRFLVTAAHVILPMLTHQAQSDGIALTAGNVVLQPDNSSLDEDLDIATVPLGDGDIEAAEAEGARILRPTVWPVGDPPRLPEQLYWAGFPRSMQQWSDLDTTSRLEPNTVVMTGPLTRVMSGRFEVVCQNDGPPMPEGLELPGLSGGPCFYFRSFGRIIEPVLCGVVSQGSRPFGAEIVAFRFASIDAIGSDGTVSKRFLSNVETRPTAEGAPEGWGR